MEEELERLRKENEAFRNDAMFALFFSINRKCNEIASSLNEVTLDITKDDKSWERFLNLQKGLKDTVETLNWLRTEFLKLPEDQVKDAEKKGIPRIEQRAKQSKR